MAEVVYPAQPVEWRSTRRISLRAVFCGVVVGLVTQFVLMVLGAAVGLTAFQPTEEAAQNVGIGYLIWLLVSLCGSAFVGAWVTSAVAGTTLRRNGLLNGGVTWALLALVGLFIVSSGLLQTGQAAVSLSPLRPSTVVPMAGAELARPENRSQLDQIANAFAFGMWGLLLAHVLPLCFALLGGVAGARSEERHLLPLAPKPRTFTPSSTTEPQPV